MPVSAEAWIRKNDHLLARASKVVVIGCGAGEHISLLLDRYPQIVIEILDFNIASFQLWKKKDLRAANEQQIGFVTAETASRNCLVLDYVNVWGLESVDYALISAELRDVEKGNIKSICQNLSLADQSKEAKTWRALREMVK